jgi:hypothetical protein
MSTKEVFFWGFGGSIAVEIVTIYQVYLSQTEIPKHYKKVGFWVVRILLAMIGSGLAVVYEVDKPLLAANTTLSISGWS